MPRLLQQSYNPNEDYTDAEVELRGRLATFLESAKSFNVIYAKVRRDSLHLYKNRVLWLVRNSN